MMQEELIPYYSGQSECRPGVWCHRALRCAKLTVLSPHALKNRQCQQFVPYYKQTVLRVRAKV
jgi:hypothetical protein